MAEQEGSETEYLRIWQPHSYIVVLGRAGRVDDDIFISNLDCAVTSLIAPFEERCASSAG